MYPIFYSIPHMMSGSLTFLNFIKKKNFYVFYFSFNQPMMVLKENVLRLLVKNTSFMHMTDR